ncbi:MAG: hypothetical protein JG768_252 [Fusobacteriales bacterium]|jgi:hypothetical protein|nr:hypothetical protein [Fusobacteriales bacterium]
MKKRLIYLILIYSFFYINIKALDTIKFESGQVANDVRMAQKLEILTKAMEVTKEKYGKYIITSLISDRVNNIRARQLMKSGELLNTFVAVTNLEWERETIPIRIPIRKGLLNYRILLIHKDDIELFKNVETLDDLKKIKIGTRLGWSTTEILRKNNFNLVLGTDYDALFSMLNSHRFSGLPRGVNEIYSEYDLLVKNRLNNIVIEKTLLLKIVTPVYIFVSKQEPRLANRLKEGMKIISKNGKLDEIFNKYYLDDIKKSNLSNRKIIEIPNPFLPPDTPLDIKEYWFNPFEN